MRIILMPFFISGAFAKALRKSPRPRIPQGGNYHLRTIPSQDKGIARRYIGPRQVLPQRKAWHIKGIRSPTMIQLSDFPVTRKWPAQHPERIQLYSRPTPNGIKILVMFEEAGIPYESHVLNFQANEQNSPEFLSINPNNKIPAILDPNGPGGKPLALFESGAILMYLAEKSGKFMPQDAALRYETIQWLMFQMGGIGPMFGQIGFFYKFAGKDYEDKRPLQRYVDEARRLLAVLNQRLEGRAWIMGDEYTIADMATLPWVRNLITSYGAGELVGLSDFGNVTRVLDAFLKRPAVMKALEQPKPA